MTSSTNQHLATRNLCYYYSNKGTPSILQEARSRAPVARLQALRRVEAGLAVPRLLGQIAGLALPCRSPQAPPPSHYLRVSAMVVAVPL